MSTSTQRLKTTQSSIISPSDHRPTFVLCSIENEFLLSQDICTLCGSLGKADEGNLISCSQCGQCYHPFCVNIKGLKVVISRGWRCLECTVCETCGLPGDEAKLLLCDECELSCHTYCLNPPLEEVPHGSWKCHWCVENRPKDERELIANGKGKSSNNLADDQREVLSSLNLDNNNANNQLSGHHNHPQHNHQRSSSSIINDQKNADDTILLDPNRNQQDFPRPQSAPLSTSCDNDDSHPKRPASSNSLLIVNHNKKSRR